MQKLLVLCFAVFISFTYVTGFYMPDQGIASQLGAPLLVISFLLFLQVFVVGMLIYYMDEVVSRWGIGSGVGLFIVAAATQQLITGLISWVPDKSGWAVGMIPRWIEIVQQVPPNEILAGGIVFLDDYSCGILNLGGILLTSIQGIGRMLYSQGITILGTKHCGLANRSKSGSRDVNNGRRSNDNRPIMAKIDAWIGKPGHKNNDP